VHLVGFYYKSNVCVLLYKLIKVLDLIWQLDIRSTDQITALKLLVSSPQEVLCVQTGLINTLFSVIGSTKIDDIGPNLELRRGTLTKIVNQSWISKSVKTLARKMYL